jgi:transposase
MPEEDLQELKLLLVERDKLVGAIKLFESSQESLQFIRRKTGNATSKHNQKTVSQLRKQLALLEQIISDLTKRNETMNTQMNLLQSIPGIGPQTALLLMCYTRCFTSFKNWRQFACYCGIAPFEYQSGTSVKGRTKVSHFAQKRLKSAIHLAALTSKKYDEEMKKYFERKVADGKNKMLVINAVRCKLISRAFAVINRGTPFVNTQKFAG